MLLSKCKVTVVRRGLDRELISRFLDDEHHDMQQCGLFSDGQEFIIERVYEIPEGFCSGAWANIRHVIERIAAGGDFPGMRNKGVEIASCADWFRPVIFKIERVE